jgi:hypothetical protein
VEQQCGGVVGGAGDQGGDPGRVDERLRQHRGLHRAGLWRYQP